MEASRSEKDKIGNSQLPSEDVNKMQEKGRTQYGRRRQRGEKTNRIQIAEAREAVYAVRGADQVAKRRRRYSD